METQWMEGYLHDIEQKNRSGGMEKQRTEGYLHDVEQKNVNET